MKGVCISSKNIKKNKKKSKKKKSRSNDRVYVEYENLDIHYDRLTEEEQKIAKDPNNYRKNAELISIFLPGFGLWYLGKKIQGIVVFFIFILFVVSFMHVSYGRWVVAAVYVIQLAYTVFCAYSQINKILLKSSTIKNNEE